MSLFLVVATLLFVRSQIRIGQHRSRFRSRPRHRRAIRPRPAAVSGRGAGAVRASGWWNGSRRFPGCRRPAWPISFRSAAIRCSGAFIQPAVPISRAHVRPPTVLGLISSAPWAFALLKGREFGSADRAGSSAVAIVNETFAKTYFPGQDMIGQHVQTEDESRRGSHRRRSRSPDWHHRRSAAIGHLLPVRTTPADPHHPRSTRRRQTGSSGRCSAPSTTSTPRCP